MGGSEPSAERVQQLIEELFPLARKHQLGPDDSLFTGGILDSLGVLDLVVALEEAFDIVVADDDLLPENFETASRIDAFIRSKT